MIPERLIRQKLALLPAPLLAKAQAAEPLDPRVRLDPREPLACDWELVSEWLDAISRLREDASTELPAVKQ